MEGESGGDEPCGWGCALKRIKTLSYKTGCCCLLVEGLADGRLYALRRLEVKGMGSRERQDAAAEVRQLSSLRHAFILSCYGSFEEKGHLNVLTDYADNGSLRLSLLSADTSKVLSWITQLAMAVDHAHKSDIVHRDITLDTIFINAKEVLKLGDFGIKSHLINQDDAQRRASVSPFFTAPEVKVGLPYQKHSDIWAFATVCKELMKDKQIEGSLPAVIDAMLSPDPRCRPSLRDVVMCDAIQVHSASFTPVLRSELSAYAARHSTSYSQPVVGPIPKVVHRPFNPMLNPSTPTNTNTTNTTDYHPLKTAPIQTPSFLSSPQAAVPCPNLRASRDSDKDKENEEKQRREEREKQKLEVQKQQELEAAKWEERQRQHIKYEKERQIKEREKQERERQLQQRKIQEEKEKHQQKMQEIERQEKERLTRLQQEKEKLRMHQEREKQEKLRQLEKERLEKERQTKLQQERERHEREKLEELRDNERRLQQERDRQQQERERQQFVLQQEWLRKEREEKERQEQHENERREKELEQARLDRSHEDLKVYELQRRKHEQSPAVSPSVVKERSHMPSRPAPLPPVFDSRFSLLDEPTGTGRCHDTSFASTSNTSVNTSVASAASNTTATTAATPGPSYGHTPFHTPASSRREDATSKMEQKQSFAQLRQAKLKERSRSKMGAVGNSQTGVWMEDAKAQLQLLTDMLAVMPAGANDPKDVKKQQVLPGAHIAPSSTPPPHTAPSAQIAKHRTTSPSPRRTRSHSRPKKEVQQSPAPNARMQKRSLAVVNQERRDQYEKRKGVRDERRAKEQEEIRLQKSKHRMSLKNIKSKIDLSTNTKEAFKKARSGGDFIFVDSTKPKKEPSHEPEEEDKDDRREARMSVKDAKKHHKDEARRTQRKPQDWDFELVVSGRPSVGDVPPSPARPPEPVHQAPVPAPVPIPAPAPVPYAGSEDEGVFHTPPSSEGEMHYDPVPVPVSGGGGPLLDDSVRVKLSSRIECLREALESQLGTETFLAIYQQMKDNNSEMEAPTSVFSSFNIEEGKARVAERMLYQLVEFEDLFYG